MAVHKISKGLNIPIAGEPTQKIDGVKKVSKVAVVAADYPTMKPKMMVAVGDTVKCGQPLFEDRKKPGVFYTAMAAGTVSAVNRGAKRALQSVVVDINESDSADDYQGFEAFASLKDSSSATADETAALLLESGMWTAFRERPYGQVPSADSRPGALFLTCTDSEPLSPDMSVLLEGHEEDFALGVKVLSTLTEKVYLCVEPGSKASAAKTGPVHVEEFVGKHPAGLAGTHIHMLYGVSRSKTAWTIHLMDIVAVGFLFRTGTLLTKRVVSLAGPQVTNPRLIETRLGAFLDEIVEGELKEGDNRVISGSPISGRSSMGNLHGFLGRHHRQISVLAEGREREFLGWLAPGGNKFSSIPVFLSALFGKKKFDFTTTTNGEHREMVPIGMYERVMPLDIIPTFLLRSLEINDLERSERLGALELDEEDVALCSFVCPGKQDYSVHLRRVLNQIYKEG